MALLWFVLHSMRLGAQSTNGLIDSFESSADLQKFTQNGLTATLSTNGVTDGHKAALMAFSLTSWPGVAFQLGVGFTNTDWHSWAGLAVDVLNTSSVPVTVDFRVG